MSEDAFVRWQRVTREHFTASSNLVLGLATGLLAFFSERFFSVPRVGGWSFFLAGVSMAALAVSVVVAIWCNINRLRDFRATAQIARRRLLNESIPVDERLDTRALGQVSWLLFRWQLILFALGALGCAISFILGVVTTVGQSDLSDSASIARILNTGGLLLNAAGVLLLFYFGMPLRVRSDGKTARTFVLADQTDLIKIDKRYDVLGRTGLALILIGTGVQVYTTWFAP